MRVHDVTCQNSEVTMSAKHEKRTVEVEVEALLYALDALDKHAPKSQSEDWYKHLCQRSDMAFQMLGLERGLFKKH